MAHNNSNTLVDEKIAISLFLDSLLTEPEIEQVTEQVVAEVKPVVEVEIAEVKITPEVISEVKVETEIQEDLSVENKIETYVESKPDSSVTESKNPEWANEPFQVLLFDVAGLTLAVPLMELSGVIEWTDSVTQMPGHADFYMGILQHLNNKIAVIDTARMVLPTNKLLQLAGDEPRDRVNHIVLIDDYRWGLACDKIGEVITLQPNEVKWRTSKSNRGWLAGTVIQHMCALLNSEGFSSMLENGNSS